MIEERLQFEDFTIDRRARELRRGGAVVPLQRIPLKLLCLLVERHGQLVTRDEILERIWGKGVFVDSENAINTAVRKVRRALCDDSDAPRFVVTVPASGYRFIAKTREPAGLKMDLAQVQAHQNPMVGRERELASLLEGLDHTAASGRGRLFLISGEPGAGKTRLAEELAPAAHARGFAVLTGNCSDQDEEAVPYLPFVEILEDCVDRATAGLSALLGDQGPELARLLPRLRRMIPDLAAPLDLPPQQSRRYLFNCFCDFVARLALEQPLLLILEDLHWADDSSLALLDHLAHRISASPILTIGTYRDVGLNLTRELAKTLENFFRCRLAVGIKLKGLPRSEVGEMLEALSGQAPPAELVSEIHGETDGNPFFVEELFRHLKEESLLYDDKGRFRIELKIDELEAPQSVRLVVARRLARLGDLTQKILGIAAVIGRSFTLQFLAAVSPLDADSLLECVEEAEKAGLVIPSADHLRFEFSHELIRQAVIGGLSAARRQQLHLDVANAIERIQVDALEDHSAELAHHYRLGGNASKAVDYLVNAAEQASVRSAHQEATSLASSGLELLNSLPHGDQRDRHELELLMTLGGCINTLRGYAAPEVERSYERALELCGRIDQAPAAIRARLGLHAYYTTRADYERAMSLQEPLLEVTQMLAGPGLVANICYAVGLRLFYQGDFEAARYYLEQVFQCGAGHRVHAFAGAAMALTMWNLGYPDQASRLVREAAAEAATLRNSFAKTMVADLTGVFHMMIKDAAGAEADADVMSRIAAEHGFVAEVASSISARGWANAWRGDPRGIDLVREAIGALQATGSEITFSWEHALIAELCLKFGRTDEAAAALDAAMAFIARTGEGFAESEVYRLKGEVELRLGRSHIGSAAKWFERALDAARKCSAKIAELRATVSLAQLLAKQSKRDNARAMLAQIYNWFTEGFDTADLKNAKALLDELSS